MNKVNLLTSEFCHPLSFDSLVSYLGIQNDQSHISFFFLSVSCLLMPFLYSFIFYNIFVMDWFLNKVFM